MQGGDGHVRAAALCACRGARNTSGVHRQCASAPVSSFPHHAVPVVEPASDTWSTPAQVTLPRAFKTNWTSSAVPWAGSAANRSTSSPAAVVRSPPEDLTTPGRVETRGETQAQGRGVESTTAEAGRWGCRPCASAASQHGHAPYKPSASSTAASAGLRRTGLAAAVPGAWTGGVAHKSRWCPARVPTDGGACLACPLGSSLLVVAVIVLVVALVAAAWWGYRRQAGDRRHRGTQLATAPQVRQERRGGGATRSAAAAELHHGGKRFRDAPFPAATENCTPCVAPRR